MSKSEFRRARKTVDVSPGESVRIIRELQKLSQNQLNLGVERAKVLARALRVHPAVLVFPGWDIDNETAA
jgi:hypothetical protein